MQNFFINNEGDSYDYYDILNVTKSSSLDDIRSNYLELSRLWHPDKLKSPMSIDQTDSIYVDESPFLKIKNAYTILSDPILHKYGHKAIDIAQSLYMENRINKKPSMLSDDIGYDKFFWDDYLDQDVPIDASNTFHNDFNDKVNSKVKDLLRTEYHQSLLNSPISFFSDFLIGVKSNLFTSIEDDRFLKPPSLVFNQSIFSGKLNVALTDKSSTQIFFERSTDENSSKNTISAFFKRKIRGFLCKIGFQTSDPSTFGKKCFYISRSVSPLFYVSQLISFDNDLYYTKTFVTAQLSDNQKIDLTFGHNEECGIMYCYRHLGMFDIEYLYNIHLSTNDLNSFIRTKYRHKSQSKLTLGFKGSYSYIRGVILEYYVRFYTFVETMHKFKIEYRLAWRPGYVCILCKLGLSNSRIIVPIELFSMPDNVGYSIHIASLITISAAVSPIFYQFAKKLLFGRFSGDSEKTNDFFDNLDELLNFDYLPGIDTLGDSNVEDNEDNININVLRARNECYELYPIARNIASSEAQSNGLVIKYAFYGDPKYVKLMSTLANQSLNLDKTLPNNILGPVMAELLLNYESHGLNNGIKEVGINQFTSLLSSSRSFDQEDTLQDRPLKLTEKDIILCKHYVIDVTNVMQSRVKSSSIGISSFSKAHLIGFANPCKDNTTCILIIRYTKNRKDITVQIEDDEYLLI